MHDPELMQLHVEALFTHDTRGQLLRVNEPHGAIAPRFFIGQTSDGPLLRFRHDIDGTTRLELQRAVAALEQSAPHRPIDPEPFRSILARIRPIEKIWAGPAFSFPTCIANTAAATPITDENAEHLRPLLDAWIDDVLKCQPMSALVVDDRAVAVCASVRQTPRAHEAGVETATEMRGRGYAAPVVAAWARAVRAMGILPLYSTSWPNVASLSVARRLGLILFGSDLHIT